MVTFFKDPVVFEKTSASIGEIPTGKQRRGNKQKAIRICGDLSWKSQIIPYLKQIDTFVFGISMEDFDNLCNSIDRHRQGGDLRSHYIQRVKIFRDGIEIEVTNNGNPYRFYVMDFVKISKPDSNSIKITHKNPTEPTVWLFKDEPKRMSHRPGYKFYNSDPHMEFESYAKYKGDYLYAWVIYPGKDGDFDEFIVHGDIIKDFLKEFLYIPDITKEHLVQIKF